MCIHIHMPMYMLLTLGPVVDLVRPVLAHLRAGALEGRLPQLARGARDRLEGAQGELQGL